MPNRRPNEITVKLWSKGITIQDLANHFNCSRPFVSESLSGKKNSELSEKIRAFARDLIAGRASLQKAV